MRPPPFALELVARHLVRRQHAAHQNARDVQEALLRRILARYRYTRLGSQLGLHDVESAADFRERIPTRSASDYAPIWNEVLEHNYAGRLHPKKLEYVCLSSGTSGTSKLIPCPPEQLAAYRRFTNHAMFHAFHALGDYSLLEENILITSAPPIKEVTEDGLVIGYGSGIATIKSPRFARQFIRPTRDILDISDGPTKVRKTIEQAFDLDIRVLTGIPLFVQPVLEELLRLAKERGVPATCARDIWPNLRVYLFSGSPLTLYEARIRRLLGEGVEFYETYSSTEAPVAYQYRFGEPGLMVDLSMAYFEFRPSGGGPRTPIHEVELGEVYDVIVTTHAGAFAYELGDRVEFLSRDPYLLRFAGRTHEEINVGGEKITVTDARSAVEQASSALDAKIRHFLLCPTPSNADEATTHHWYVEFETPPRNPRAFASELDAALGDQSEIYRLIRDEGVLGPPRCTQLPAGTIDRFLARSRTFGQGKLPHLHNDRVVADELDALMRMPRAKGA